MNNNNCNWRAEKALENWLNTNFSEANSQAEPFKKNRLYQEGEIIPIEELEYGLIKAAKLVEDLGITYIDIFERIEKELKDAQTREQTFQKIKSITKKIDSKYLVSKTNIYPLFQLSQYWLEVTTKDYKK